MAGSGSDFAPEYFNEAENVNFEKILARLRSFEKTIAHSFRNLEGRLKTLENETKKNKDSLTGVKGSITKLRNSMNKKLENLAKGLKNGEEESSDDDEEEAEDGNAGGDEQEEAENGNAGGNDGEFEPEVIVLDPFLSNGFSAGTFDGNPMISFTKWVEKFKDILTLMTTPLNEAQKLARLRFCLAGQARIVYDSAAPQPTTLDAAITLLKEKFENGNNKAIARQALSICRQAPGEPVFEFANRLNESVRSVLAGEGEDVIRKRLLDEFLDRMTPDLQYEVKGRMPADYGSAYELAQHYELLIRARRPAQISVNNLAENIETLAIHKSDPRIIECYKCRGEGHMARNCPSNYVERNDGNWQNSNNWKNGNNYRQENRNNGSNGYRQNYRNNRSNNNGNYKRNFDNYRRNTSYKDYDSRGRRDDRSSSRDSERSGYSNRNRSNEYRRGRRDRDNYNERENRDNHSPTRHVGFSGRGSPSVRTVSPFFLAIIAMFCLLGMAIPK